MKFMAYRQDVLFVVGVGDGKNDMPLRREALNEWYLVLHCRCASATRPLTSLRSCRVNTIVFWAWIHLGTCCREKATISAYRKPRKHASWNLFLIQSCCFLSKLQTSTVCLLAIAHCVMIGSETLRQSVTTDTMLDKCALGHL